MSPVAEEYKQKENPNTPSPPSPSRTFSLSPHLPPDIHRRLHRALPLLVPTSGTRHRHRSCSLLSPAVPPPTIGPCCEVGSRWRAAQARPTRQSRCGRGGGGSGGGRGRSSGGGADQRLALLSHGAGAADGGTGSSPMQASASNGGAGAARPGGGGLMSLVGL
jgi:hypothetical protein